MDKSPDTSGNTHVLWCGGDISLQIVDTGLDRSLQLTQKGDILHSVTMRSVRRIEVGLPGKGGDGGPGTDPKFLREMAESLADPKFVRQLADEVAGDPDSALRHSTLERLHDIADRLDYLNPSPPALEDKAFKWLADCAAGAIDASDEGDDLNGVEPVVIALYSLVVATKRAGTMSAVGGVGSVLGNLFRGLGTDRPGFDTVQKGK